MRNLIKNLISATLLLAFSAVSQAEVTVTYLHTDAAGSVVAASDENGGLAWRKSYLPYGGKHQDGQPESRAVGYTGHTHDNDTGLTYMKARSYDPELQRFIQMDPASVLGHAESNPMMFNRFAYANNNPYKYVDPDGRAGKVASGVIFVGNGIRKVGRLTKEAAVRLRRQGKNIHSDNKQIQMQIERAANVGNNKILDHRKRHQLKNPDGSLKFDADGNPVVGAGHIQAQGVSGHNFSGSQGVVNSIIAATTVGASIGLEAVGGALETFGEGLEKVEEKFPRTMQLLDPIGTIMEQEMAEPLPCSGGCEA